MKHLLSARESVNAWIQRFGVRFGVYKNGVFNEQLFPFDAIPAPADATTFFLRNKSICFQNTLLFRLIPTQSQAENTADNPTERA